MKNLQTKMSSWIGVYLCCLCCFFMAKVAAASEYSVPDDFATIQSAIDAALSDDVIFVGPGTYSENIDFNGKAISIVSTDGPGQTIIEAAGGTVVTMGPNAEIDGFTIRNGSASFGAGMSVKGTGSRIIGNIFDSNSQTAGGFGAAIGGNGASALIERNIFKNNDCDNQFLSGVVSFVNTSAPRIVNNIFADNPCRAINSTLPSTGMPVVMNNTIVRNRVGIRVDRRIPTSQQIYRNNIIVDNEIGLEVDFGNESNNPTWENNLVHDNDVNYDGILDQTGMSGNISSAPFFVDPSVDNFRLLGGSPAIDAGTPIDAPNVDFDNDARPVDGDGDSFAGFDIGAHEYVANTSIVEVSPAGKYPFATALIMTGDDTKFCGGSLIAPTWVLSAAHCFTDAAGIQDVLPADVDALIGRHDLTTTAGYVTRSRASCCTLTGPHSAVKPTSKAISPS